MAVTTTLSYRYDATKPYPAEVCIGIAIEAGSLDLDTHPYLVCKRNGTVQEVRNYANHHEARGFPATGYEKQVDVDDDRTKRPVVTTR